MPKDKTPPKKLRGRDAAKLKAWNAPAVKAKDIVATNLDDPEYLREVVSDQNEEIKRLKQKLAELEPEPKYRAGQKVWVRALVVEVRGSSYIRVVSRDDEEDLDANDYIDVHLSDIRPAKLRKRGARNRLHTSQTVISE